MTAVVVGTALAAAAGASLVEAVRRSWAADEPDAPPGRRWRAVRGPMAWWAALLDDAGVAGDPARWARVAAMATAALGGLGAWRSGPSGAALLLALAVVVAVVARTASRGRGARRADAALPDLLDHVGRGLRSGHDVVGALRVAASRLGGGHGDEVLAVTARVDRGADLAAALGPWEEAHPRPPVRLAVAALEVAVAAGGSPARALDGVAATLRDRAAVVAEARALASQAQASAAVLVALPLVFALGSASADGQVAGALLGTGSGRMLLVVAVALDLVGALWMHRILGER